MIDPVEYLWRSALYAQTLGARSSEDARQSTEPAAALYWQDSAARHYAAARQYYAALLDVQRYVQETEWV